MLFQKEKNNKIENLYNESVLETLRKLHLMNTYLTLKSKRSLVFIQKIHIHNKPIESKVFCF